MGRADTDRKENTMKNQNEKCVMILLDRLPLGLAANTAAIMGITLGKLLPGAVGPDVTDQSGMIHPGIIAFPVPILCADAESLSALFQKLRDPVYADLTIVDFSDLAQGCKTYDEYTQKMGQTPEERLSYLGLALCGPKKKVNRFTGCMALLR